MTMEGFGQGYPNIIPSHRNPKLAQLSSELRLLQNIAPVASLPNRLHGELTEWATNGSTSQLLPTIKGLSL